jgi:hypothetical protein
LKKKLLYSFIIPCIVACNPDDTFKGISVPPTEIRYMNDSLKSYYFFTVGSRWVYQRTDTNINIYDTVTVIRSVSESFYDHHSSYQIEQVAVNFQHSYYKSSPNSSNPLLNVSMRNGYDGVNRVSMRGGGPLKLFSSYGGFLSHPIDSLSILNNSIGSGEESYLIRKYDTLIDNNNIINVLELNQNAGSFFDETIHIAPNVGIVRFENSFDYTQWVLKEYQVTLNQ